MKDFDDDPDLAQMKQRLEQDQRAAIVVWLNMLQRAPVDDVTWMRLGYSYLRLGEISRAIAAFMISTLINSDGKGTQYLKTIQKSPHGIPIDVIDLYVVEWLEQFDLLVQYRESYKNLKTQFEA
jgi:predicted TPR repeat methyltransferase